MLDMFIHKPPTCVTLTRCAQNEWISSVLNSDLAVLLAIAVISLSYFVSF
jgi:hypothetical protein